MKVTVAVLDKQRNNIVGRVLELLPTLGDVRTSHFGLVSPTKSLLDKNLDIMSRQSLVSSAMIGYVSSKPASASGYEFLQLDDAALVFEGRVYSPIPKTAVMEQVAKEPLHCEALLQTLIQNADGDYSFLMVKDGWIAAGRDPVGVQPLYYGENQDIAAIATNRTSPMETGHRKPHVFSAWKHRLCEPRRLPVKPVKTLTFAEPRQ